MVSLKQASAIAMMSGAAVLGLVLCELNHHTHPLHWIMLLAIIAMIAGFVAWSWGFARCAQKESDAHKIALLASKERYETANRLYRAILEGAQHSIIAVDRDGIIMHFNGGAEKILGYKREEMLGKKTPEVFHLKEEMQAEADALTLKLGRPVEPGFFVFTVRALEQEVDEREWTYVNKDGSHIPVSLAITALRNKVGELTGFVGIARDLSLRKKAEKALVASEERTRLFAEHAPAAVAMFDREMRYLVVSQYWQREYNLVGQSLIGKSHYEVFPEITQRWKDIHERCLAGEVMSQEEDLFETSKGKMWLSWEIHPWYEQSGKVGGIVMFTRDITARQIEARALTESEERFRQAFEFAAIGMAIIGMNGSWIRVNKTVCEILGYPEEELLTKTFQEITHPEDLDKDLKLVNELVEQKRRYFQLEKRYFHRDGHIVWVRLTASLVRNTEDEPVHFVSQLEDITEHKRLQENLAQARDEAIAASRLKSEFLTNMSHEIRTPMNGIVGMSNLLMETQLTAEQQEMGSVIRNSSESLLNIINDILDFSKIEAGKLNIDPDVFDPLELVEETMQLLAPHAHDKGLELINDFQMGTSRQLFGDAGRIRQILLNLLSNAIKFTDSGHIIVRVEPITEDLGKTVMRCEVIDTGIGISSEGQEKLFRPFTQADGSITRRFGGSGLGLAISRQLVELMGGKINFESNPGKGSRFWFELPLPERPAVNPPLTPILGKKILVVEGNEAFKHILLQQLASIGVTVESITDPRKALPRLTEASSAGEPYDMMIMEWKMPHMDGIALAKVIRSHPLYGKLPLVLLSSSTAVSEQKAIENRICAILAKPVRLAQLHRTLAKFLLEPQKPLQTNRTPSAISGKSYRLLLAEDNHVNQMVACRILEKMGHQVDVVADGAAALSRLSQSTRYDAILMDCQMPVMDGYTATQRIREGAVEGLDTGIPIIALTANAMPEERARCLAIGMTDFITKPIRIPEIQEALRRGIEENYTAQVAADSFNTPT